jgi:hypothetical protein
MTDLTPTDDSAAAAALHAAETWLQRLQAPDDSIVVVEAMPATRIGVWRSDHDAPLMAPEIDDSGADLCDGVAPAIQVAINHLDDEQHEQLAQIGVQGGVLRLLLLPATGRMALHLFGGTASGVLAECRIERTAH